MGCAAQRVGRGRIQLDAAPDDRLVLFDEVVVQIHAPARLVVGGDETVLHLQHIGDQLGVQPLFPRLVLKEGGVVGAHAEVDVDAVCQRAERVVGAELAETGFCHGGDLPHLGEAAAEQDVRLQQIHGVQRQQALPRIGVEDLLAGGQRNVQALRHFGPCFQIVRADRLLHKEGIKANVRLSLDLVCQISRILMSVSLITARILQPV